MSADVCTAGPWTLTVAWDPGRTSPNLRLNRYDRARRNREARWAGYAAWVEAGSPRSPLPVRVSITVYRDRAMDDDNAVGGLKHVRDGIFGGNLTPDDTTAWVRLVEIRVISGPQWRKGPFVVFHVESIPGVPLEP